MKKVEIFEQILTNNVNQVGKFTILRGGLGEDNPTEIMNRAVEKYVGDKPYNEFTEIFLDNPWVRVIVSGINDLRYTDFTDQKL